MGLTHDQKPEKLQFLIYSVTNKVKHFSTHQIKLQKILDHFQRGSRHWRDHALGIQKIVVLH